MVNVQESGQIGLIFEFTHIFTELIYNICRQISQNVTIKW